MTFGLYYQSFVQKRIGVKYIDYDYSPTQQFQHFQAFSLTNTDLLFSYFTLHIIYYLILFNNLYYFIFITL